MSESIVSEFKISKSDFTRIRKQSFSSTLLFMMNFLKKSLSIEIENFMSFLKDDICFLKHKPFTKSAFVQCRKKIKPEVFKHLSSLLVGEFYTDNEGAVKRWNNFRLLSVDGSRLTLPNTKELKRIYGEAKNNTKTSIVQARLSVLYDVLNDYAIDGLLSPLSSGEKALAIEHLKYTMKGDLIIYDRGYPSFELIYEHDKIGIDFLIRVKIGFSGLTQAFYDSGNKSEIVKMFPGKNTKISEKEYTRESFVKIRLVRVDLPDGTVEILISSLLDTNEYKNKLFKELYFKRWKVETYYDELKNKLKLECFSGYSNHSVQQDFNAALFVSNVQTLLVTELNEELNKGTQETKYKYKINTNLSYGFLKDKIISLFLSDSEISEIISELKELFSKNLIPIRPNRKFDRDVGKYRNRIKPKITKNQRDAI